MKRVAKLILVDKDNKHLILYRSDHPAFPNDPDLPGGILEEGEEPTQALTRELLEETGITLGRQTLEKVCESNRYDKEYIYYLYRAIFDSSPDISISWEHSGYEWLSLEDFIAKSHTAVDKYMHMVYDYLSQNGSRPTS